MGSPHNQPYPIALTVLFDLKIALMVELTGPTSESRLAVLGLKTIGQIRHNSTLEGVKSKRGCDAENLCDWADPIIKPAAAGFVAFG
jgi:hypothetical protein